MPQWTLRRLLGALRPPSLTLEKIRVFSSTRFTAHSSAVPWNFVGLWQVALAHCFHCGSDVSRGNERVSLLLRLRGRLWPRVSTEQASSPSLPSSSHVSFSFAGSLDEKEMGAVREAVFGSTNKRASGALIRNKMCRRNTVKEVLFTDMLDKSDVQHFAELEFGVVLPRSTSGVEAVSEGNLPLTQLTSVDIGVRASATWNTSVAFSPKSCGIFTGASRSPCELVTVATSTSSGVLWNFVGLWHVAVVHCFHCGCDASRGNERVSLPRRLRGATVAAGVHSASQLALSSVLFTRVVLVCGLATQCHAQTDENEMGAVREAVFGSTNKHASGVHSFETKCAVGTP